MTRGNSFWDPCASYVPETGGSVTAVTLKEGKCDTTHQGDMSQEQGLMQEHLAKQWSLRQWQKGEHWPSHERCYKKLQ